MPHDTVDLTENWDFFRRQMPVAAKWAYFDHAAVAPVPLPAREAVLAWSAQAANEGDTVCSDWTRQIELLRKRVAMLIGAHEDEVALVPNTTAGISLVAEGFPWRRGDNVVTLENEFPSNLYPWMNLAGRGVRTRRVRCDGGRVDPNRVAEACDERTRIVSISWVGFGSGWRIDVPEMARLAHDHGALLFLDAIQALGVFPIDVHRANVDFLAADGHKWMLGPEGAGVFFLRREHLDLLRPVGVGWNSVVHTRDFDHIELNIRPEAARYEGGSMNTAGFLALRASLDLLAGLGLSPSARGIADRVLDVTDLACTRLEEIGARITSHRRGEHRSGIVAFEMPGRDPLAEVSRCRAEHIALTCRSGRLRISPHAYTNEEDVDRLLSVLRRKE